MRQVAIGITLIVFTLGIRIWNYYSELEPYESGSTFVYQGILWDEPKRTSQYQSIRLSDIRVQLPLYPDYQYGDSLVITGIVEQNSFTSKEGEKVTELVLKRPQVQEYRSPFFIRVASGMREKIITTITSLLPSDHAALLLGITLGVKEEFDSELYQMFRDAGILHIIVASGSNISILAGVVLSVANIVVKRRAALGITAGVVAWYAVLSGFDPAILRASIMAGITFLAGALGRQQLAYSALVITAWLMLMAEPRLLQSPSFQLSFAATFGIVYLKPVLDRIKWSNGARIVKEDFNTTIAAQWGALPILVSWFGTLQPLAILTNLFVLWSVPFIMIFGLLASVFSLFTSYASLPFVYLAYPLLSYFLTVVRLFQPLSVNLAVGTIPIFLTVSYYLFSLSFIVFLKQKKA